MFTDDMDMPARARRAEDIGRGLVQKLNEDGADVGEMLSIASAMMFSVAEAINRFEDVAKTVDNLAKTLREAAAVSKPN